MMICFVAHEGRIAFAFVLYVGRIAPLLASHLMFTKANRNPEALLFKLGTLVLFKRLFVYTRLHSDSGLQIDKGNKGARLLFRS